MKRTHLLILITVAAWAVAFYGVWAFVGEYFAPDACLDAGGSFDYEIWKCSMTATHKYIESPIYQVPKFGFAAYSWATALVSTAALHLTRRSTPSLRAG